MHCKTLEQTISQIHITNWVNTLWEVNTSWHLAESMRPLMLDTLHVPLVDDYHYFLLRTLVNSLEQILITLVDEDLFESWEVNVQILDVPVDHVWVHAFLGELRRLRVVHSKDQIFFFN